VRKNLFWLSDEQWQRIEPFLPTDTRGVARVDDRRVISGIVHVLKSGCRWSDCPPEYGPPTTIYNRFVRWARRGIWENLFRELAGNGRSADMQMIDSTHVKAHRSAAGGKGGSRSRLLARARGRIGVGADIGLRQPIADGVVEHDPEKRKSVFRIRSCSNKKLDHDLIRSRWIMV
jgi:transposase